MVTFFVLAMSLGGAALNAWAAQVMWGWFIVPTGVQPLSYISGLAVGVMANCYIMDYSPSKQSESDRISYAITTILKPLVTVGCGWVIRQFA